MRRDWLKAATDKLHEAFFKNPVAWILLTLLLLAEWGNYKNGHDLRLVCDLVAPHLGTVADKYATTVGQKVDNICLRHEPDDDDN
jgi:hypothetical protein